MLQKLEDPAFYLGIIGAIILLLSEFGYNIPLNSDQMQALAKALSVVVTIGALVVGYLRNHQTETQITRLNEELTIIRAQEKK